MSGLTNPFGSTCFAVSAIQLIAGCDPLLNAYDRHNFFHKDESGKKNTFVKWFDKSCKICISNSSFICRIVYDMQS